MPWIVSFSIVVTTVTPVANRPITCRMPLAISSTAAARGVSRATPVCGGSAGVPFPWRGVPGPPGGFGGGISPVSLVGVATRVSRAMP